MFLLWIERVLGPQKVSKGAEGFYQNRRSHPYDSQNSPKLWKHQSYTRNIRICIPGDMNMSISTTDSWENRTLHPMLLAFLYNIQCHLPYCTTMLLNKRRIFIFISQFGGECPVFLGTCCADICICIPRDTNIPHLFSNIVVQYGEWH